MREMSVTEQRYKAVLAVIADGRTVGEVADERGVCRQTMHPNRFGRKPRLQLVVESLWI